MFVRFSTVLVALFIAGCDGGYMQVPVTETAQRAAPDNLRIVRLDETNIAQYSVAPESMAPSTMPADRRWTYRVGVGDTLNVVVFGHPDLTLPLGRGDTAQEFGFRVRSDGNIFYPFVGQVAAKGRLPEDIRAEIQARLAEYIANPQVEVTVAGFNSQHATVTGEVHTSQRLPLTRDPLTLLAAINAAGGLTDRADPSRIMVRRGTYVYRVNLSAFLSGAVMGNNPVLRNGDVVTVPRLKNREAFLLGEVVSPASVDLGDEPVSLTQALARQGGLDELRADARGIFIFRWQDNVVTAFQLDARTPESFMLGTRFVLRPQDVVYITRSPLQRWNDTITRLLPTVGAINTSQNVVD